MQVSHDSRVQLGQKGRPVGAKVMVTATARAQAAVRIVRVRVRDGVRV